MAYSSPPPSLGVEPVGGNPWTATVFCVNVWSLEVEETPLFQLAGSSTRGPVEYPPPLGLTLWVASSEQQQGHWSLENDLRQFHRAQSSPPPPLGLIPRVASSEQGRQLDIL